MLRSIITNTLHNFSYSSCLLPTLALSVHNYISCTLLITQKAVYAIGKNIVGFSISVEIWDIRVAGTVA